MMGRHSCRDHKVSTRGRHTLQHAPCALGSMRSCLRKRVHLPPSSSHRDAGRHALGEDAFCRFGISVTPPGTCPLCMKGYALTRNATPEGGTALAVENVHGMHHGAPLQPLEERSCVSSRAWSPAYIACTEDECPVSPCQTWVSQ